MINLFFVIHDHSGARTYANELLGYLSTQTGIAVHKVYLRSKECTEYTEIKERNILVIHIPRVRKTNYTMEKYAARCIDFISPLLQHKENIIFHLNYSTQVKLGLEVRKRFGALLIYTLHYLPEHFFYLAYNGKLNEQLDLPGDVLDIKILNEADSIICISRFAKEAICWQYNISASKINVIYNGIGGSETEMLTNTKEIKQSLGFKEDEQLILFLGRLEGEEKGVYGLIRSFKRIVKEFPKARLVLANKGDFNEIMECCQNIMGRVTYTGFLQKEQLQKLCSIADIGVIPSSFELLGYVPIEMMFHQLPIVIANSPGMNELIQDGINGLVCALENKADGSLELEVDERSLYKKMKILLMNKILAKQLALNGRKHWEHNFTAMHFGLATMQVYKNKLVMEKQNVKPVFLEAMSSNA